MPLFRKDDHNAAMRHCLEALTALVDGAREHAPTWDDDIWQARVRRRLVDAGAGVFLWGFLDKLASKDVSDWRTRANVVEHALARTFDHETATAVASSLPVEPRDRGLGRGLFTDGQQAALGLVDKIGAGGGPSSHGVLLAAMTSGYLKTRLKRGGELVRGRAETGGAAARGGRRCAPDAGADRPR